MIIGKVKRIPKIIKDNAIIDKLKNSKNPKGKRDTLIRVERAYQTSFKDPKELLDWIKRFNQMVNLYFVHCKGDVLPHIDTNSSEGKCFLSLCIEGYHYFGDAGADKNIGHPIKRRLGIGDDNYAIYPHTEIIVKGDVFIVDADTLHWLYKIKEDINFTCLQWEIPKVDNTNEGICLNKETVQNFLQCINGSFIEIIDDRYKFLNSWGKQCHTTHI